MMIMNNLDPDVAQFPEELVTYGGSGQGLYLYYISLYIKNLYLKLVYFLSF